MCRLRKMEKGGKIVIDGDENDEEKKWKKMKFWLYILKVFFESFVILKDS